MQHGSDDPTYRKGYPPFQTPAYAPPYYAPPPPPLPVTKKKHYRIIPIIVLLSILILGALLYLVSLPRLKTSYTGHLSSGYGKANLTVTIKSNGLLGDFTGYGTSSSSYGQCPFTIEQGQVHTDKSLQFTMREAQIAGTLCGATGEYSGNIHPDGSMSGTWTVQNMGQGAWDLS